MNLTRDPAQRTMHKFLVLTIVATVSCASAFVPTFSGSRGIVHSQMQTSRQFRKCHSRVAGTRMTATEPSRASYVYDSTGRQRQLPSLCDLDAKV